MFAVLALDGDDLPEVYVFTDEAKANEFLDWLYDTDPSNDGTDEYRESGPFVVVPVIDPPDHWDKAPT